MPRPEGYASLQFSPLPAPTPSGKQVLVQCNHCHSKTLSRSVASRKERHLLRECVEFHRYVADLAASGSQDYLQIPDVLRHGLQKGSTEAQRNYVDRHQQGQIPQRAQAIPQRVSRPTNSLPGLLDGVEADRSRTSPMDDLRDWNSTLNGGDTTMDESLLGSTSARQSIRHTDITDSVPPHRSIAFAQRAAHKRQEKIDSIITRAIYEGSLPFNIGDATKHPAMAEFFALVEYAPPGRHKIADDVYDQAYDQTQDHQIVPYSS